MAQIEPAFHQPCPKRLLVTANHYRQIEILSQAAPGLIAQEQVISFDKNNFCIGMDQSGTCARQITLAVEDRDPCGRRPGPRLQPCFSRRGVSKRIRSYPCQRFQASLSVRSNHILSTRHCRSGNHPLALFAHAVHIDSAARRAAPRSSSTSRFPVVRRSPR